MGRMHTASTWTLAPRPREAFPLLSVSPHLVSRIPSGSRTQLCSNASRFESSPDRTFDEGLCSAKIVGQNMCLTPSGIRGAVSINEYLSRITFCDRSQSVPGRRAPACATYGRTSSNNFPGYRGCSKNVESTRRKRLPSAEPVLVVLDFGAGQPQCCPTTFMRCPHHAYGGAGVCRVSGVQTMGAFRCA